MAMDIQGAGISLLFNAQIRSPLTFCEFSLDHGAFKTGNSSGSAPAKHNLLAK
jgi:hypothetical protein